MDPGLKLTDRALTDTAAGRIDPWQTATLLAMWWL